MRQAKSDSAPDGNPWRPLMTGRHGVRPYKEKRRVNSRSRGRALSSSVREGVFGLMLVFARITRRVAADANADQAGIALRR
jgi:hypothetical protein